MCVRYLMISEAQHVCVCDYIVSSSPRRLVYLYLLSHVQKQKHYALRTIKSIQVAKLYVAYNRCYVTELFFLNERKLKKQLYIYSDKVQLPSTHLNIQDVKKINTEKIMFTKKYDETLLHRFILLYTTKLCVTRFGRLLKVYLYLPEHSLDIHNSQSDSLNSK